MPMALPYRATGIFCPVCISGQASCSTKGQADKSAVSSEDGEQSAKADDKPIPEEGKFASVACSLLMQVHGPRSLRARIYCVR